MPDVEISLTQEQRQQLSTNPSLRGTPVDPQYREALTALRQGIIANRANTELTRLVPAGN